MNNSRLHLTALFNHIPQSGSVLACTLQTPPAACQQGLCCTSLPRHPSARHRHPHKRASVTLRCRRPIFVAPHKRCSSVWWSVRRSCPQKHRSHRMLAATSPRMGAVSLAARWLPTPNQYKGNKQTGWFITSPALTLPSLSLRSPSCPFLLPLTSE